MAFHSQRDGGECGQLGSADAGLGPAAGGDRLASEAGIRGRDELVGFLGDYGFQDRVRGPAVDEKAVGRSGALHHGGPVSPGRADEHGVGQGISGIEGVKHAACNGGDHA
jgi:hypothetical protein